jgi:hypothetical protein
MRTKPWSRKYGVKDGDNYPATDLDWDDAVEFCDKLNDHEHRAGRLPESIAFFSLPTGASSG